MTHLHKASGLTFECGELMEFPVDGTRKTYDITVITSWDRTEDGCEPVIIVGFYFGEYDAELTDYYIDKWFQEQAMDNEWLKIVSDCKDVVEAYWVTNEDVLADDEYSDQRSKVKRTLTNLNRILEVITNESMP